MPHRELPHRRFNPLKEEWVLVSPHRTERPWQGATERSGDEPRQPYDAECYLCPGNTRAGGKKNPTYSGTFVFDNDFPALLPSTERGDLPRQYPEFIRSAPERGLCRVICFSPRHDLSLPELSADTIFEIITTWREQSMELAVSTDLNHIMIFENKGLMMGCSNPHPHGQLWATETLPTIPARSIAAQRHHHRDHGTPLLHQYLAWELQEGERVVSQNEHWVTLVPFWAQWPFETLLLPKRSVATIALLSAAERGAWAEAIKDITTRYDNLFTTSFPYSMGVYQPPLRERDQTYFTLHQLFLPPLLRSATVRKFMVGYELCAEPQRDLTPELSAAKLRECSTVHYKESHRRSTL